jgi:hypothetical protein
MKSWMAGEKRFNEVKERNESIPKFYDEPTIFQDNELSPLVSCLLCAGNDHCIG